MPDSASLTALDSLLASGIMGRMLLDSGGSREPIKPTLQDVYPTLTEQELKEAEANLARYIEIAFEICEEIRAAPEANAVDTTAPGPIIRERSNNAEKT